ncbi:MAG: hypothetical protein II543_04670, partial [Desulfovibrio sp.]|nr:hypothetical protein [Desulfovibrio sp.]
EADMAKTLTGPASKDTAKGKKFPLKKVGAGGAASDSGPNLKLTNSTDQARSKIMGNRWSKGVNHGEGKPEGVIKKMKPSKAK